jgi:predicted negative regulator of RcsB-dependent stress response
MMKHVALVSLVVLALAGSAAAQGPPLALPEASPAATISQRVGLTDITITYHRPAVNKRPVWGTLVPYGHVWRAGANENTVIAFSSEVSIGGQKIPAGSYGLHLIPTDKDWTLILNRESHAWGSFFYDEKDDVARLPVTPKPADFQERLGYTFDDPSDAGVTAVLRWEKIAVPIAIAVDTPAVVAASLRTQLRGLQGFSWQAFAQAATWCARHDVNLEEAQVWAERAKTLNENFTTLRARALVAEKRGDAAMATTLRDKSLTMATEADMNALGYQLLTSGKVDEAIAVFTQNVAKYPASWNAHDSLGEGLAAAGRKAEAAEHYRKARAMVKDETNQKRIDGVLKGLSGTD